MKFGFMGKAGSKFRSLWLTKIKPAFQRRVQFYDTHKNIFFIKSKILLAKKGIAPSAITEKNFLEHLFRLKVFTTPDEIALLEENVRRMESNQVMNKVLLEVAGSRIFPERARLVAAFDEWIGELPEVELDSVLGKEPVLKDPRLIALKNVLGLEKTRIFATRFNYLYREYQDAAAEYEEFCREKIEEMQTAQFN